MSDVPLCENNLLIDDPFESESYNNPLGFDLCIECIDGAQFPSAAELKCIEQHLQQLERLWADRCALALETGSLSANDQFPSRPAPSAKHVIHLAFPSSPGSSQYSITQTMAFISFLQRLLYPAPIQSSNNSSDDASPAFSPHRASRKASSSFKTSAKPPPRKCRALLFSSDGYTETSILALCLLMAHKPAHYHTPQPLASSLLSTLPDALVGHGSASPNKIRPSLSRLSSAQGPIDGGSSSWSRGNMSLPEAYLELQNARHRSFFVYPHDLDFLRKIETKLLNDAEDAPRDSIRTGRGVEPKARGVTIDSVDSGPLGSASSSAGSGKWKWATWGASRTGSLSIPSGNSIEDNASPIEESTPPSLSSALPSLSTSTPGNSIMTSTLSVMTPKRRARASTSPMPSVLSEHYAWFSDPRFDGSFPSRVLPFLYLGNL